MSIDTIKEYHANKSERLKSFENTVRNIFNEKLEKIYGCFVKDINNITHIQILNNYGQYFFYKVDSNDNYKNVLIRYDVEGRRNNNNKKEINKLITDAKISFKKRYNQHARYIL